MGKGNSKSSVFQRRVVRFKFNEFVQFSDIQDNENGVYNYQLYVLSGQLGLPQYGKDMVNTLDLTRLKDKQIIDFENNDMIKGLEIIKGIATIQTINEVLRYSKVHTKGLSDLEHWGLLIRVFNNKEEYEDYIYHIQPIDIDRQYKTFQDHSKGVCVFQKPRQDRWNMKQPLQKQNYVIQTNVNLIKEMMLNLSFQDIDYNTFIFNCHDIVIIACMIAQKILLNSGAIIVKTKDLHSTLP